MGTLDFLTGAGATPTLAPPQTGGSFSYPSPPKPARTALETFNLNDAFDKFSQGGATLYGTLGQVPSRVYEAPVALADVALQRTLGFSPVDALGKTPVGGVAGFAGEAINRAGNFAPALINSTDANVWKAIGDLPDNTPITDDLVRQKLEAMGESSLFAEGEKTEGVPVLGALPFLRHIFGGRAKTVGEFRDELEKRGFFFDATGAPIDPTQMALDLRTGKRSTFDFGDRAVNDNALVDLATRVSLDPSNALFFVPGAGLARIGSLAAKVLPAARLVRAGEIVAKAPAALDAAEAIQKGNRAAATLAGMSRALQAYRKLSIGTAIGTFGAQNLTGFINDRTGDSLPFLPEIEEFTKAVNERRPMSGNAAFMLFSAATFPVGHYYDQAKGLAKGARQRAFGVGDMAPFHKEYGGKAAFYDEFGGQAGERQLADFIDKQIARDQRRMTPRQIADIQSIADVALRRRIEQQALERIVDDMRRHGEITGDMRLAKFKEWHSQQGGFEGKDLANPWDPIRAARRWRSFEPIRQMVDPILRDTGEVIWGLRDDVIFTEQVDAIRDVLRNARVKGADGKVRVPVEAILNVLEDHPNLNSLDRHGFWQRFADKKAEAPTWDAISRRLGRTRRESTKIADYTKDMADWERAAPEDIPDPQPIISRAERIDQLESQLQDTLDENGTIHPDRVEESQAIQRELETLKAEENGVHWAKMGEKDAKSGADAEVGRKAEESLPAEVAPVHLSPGLDRLPPDVVGRVIQLEKELVQANPSYRLKRAPLKKVLALVPEDGAITTAIRQHSALGEWLHVNGPLSTLSGFVHALTRPVGRDELFTDAKNALGAQMVTHGAKGRQVEAFLAELREEVKRSERHPFGFIPGLGDFTIRLKRDIGSIEPSEVNRIGAQVFGKKVTESVGGNFYRVLSKASSRYWRSLDAKASRGDRVAGKLERIYDIWNDSPAFTQVAAAQRTLAKYYYPLFRFVADVRWLALNAVEANFLALGKDGMRKAYGSIDEASRAARYFNSGLDAEAAASFVPDTGWSLGRQLELFALKLFDKRSAKSVAKVIDEYGKNDPAIVALRENLIREAQDNLAAAERQFKDGDITERTYESLRAKAERQMRAGVEDLSTHLNDTLYRYETKGVENTVIEEARATLDADELRVMQPLIDRVAEVNRKTWDDVQHMLHGNPSRSTMERLANSYWLYWPISYQIKAAKWLTDIMLSGSFGHDNNALLAGKYQLWQEQHRDRLMHNPAYAALYAAQPTLWFAAQMFLPISPEDIGVSLGKASDLLGTKGQEQINKWFGTDIGAFTAYKEAEDPGNAIAWLTNMGPSYTFELLQRIFNEIPASSNESQATSPVTVPIPSTAGGQVPVPVR